MMRKYHVRFLEGLGAATSPCLLSKICELFGRIFDVRQNSDYGSAPNAKLSSYSRFVHAILIEFFLFA